jgi:hypothetical protein
MLGEERGDGVAAGPSEALGERVKRGAFGARECDGEWAASSVASDKLSGASHSVFVEEAVAVVLVGDHDQVRERIPLLGDVADSLGEVEGKRQTDLMAGVIACGGGWHRAKRTRAGRRSGPRWLCRWLGFRSFVGRFSGVRRAPTLGLARFFRVRLGADAKAGELRLAEPSHAQPVALAPVRALMRVRISSARAW